MVDDEGVKIGGHEAVQVGVGPELGGQLEGAAVGAADLEGADGQRFVVEGGVVAGHAVRAAEVAGAVDARGGRLGLALGRLPQVAAVRRQEEGQLQQVDVVPEERRALAVGERHEVAGQEGGRQRGDVGALHQEVAVVGDLALGDEVGGGVAHLGRQAVAVHQQVDDGLGDVGDAGERVDAAALAAEGRRVHLDGGLVDRRCHMPIRVCQVSTRKR